MKVNQIALAMVLGLGSTTLALADATDKSGKQSGGETSGYSRTVVDKPRDVAVSPFASTYWTDHAKDGYISREKALEFKGADGKPADWDKLDKDKDGRASHAEWIAYHNQAANLKRNDPEASGSAGRTGN